VGRVGSFNGVLTIQRDRDFLDVCFLEQLLHPFVVDRDSHAGLVQSSWSMRNVAVSSCSASRLTCRSK
jgi:hypothetical protein